MATYLARDTSTIEFRRVETPPDLHAACGIGVGVMLGIVAWAAIIAVSVAVMGWL